MKTSMNMSILRISNVLLFIFYKYIATTLLLI